MKKEDFIKKIQNILICGSGFVLINGWKVIHADNIDESLDIDIIDTVEKCYLVDEKTTVSLTDGTLVNNIVLI
jgi:hypothetical protein